MKTYSVLARIAGVKEIYNFATFWLTCTRAVSTINDMGKLRVPAPTFPVEKLKKNRKRYQLTLGVLLPLFFCTEATMKVRQNYRFYPAIDRAVKEMAEKHKTTKTKVVEALIWRAYNKNFKSENQKEASKQLVEA